MSAAIAHPPAGLVRSEPSLAFEAMWRGLRRKGSPIPARNDFHPAKAVKFLREIVLVEVPCGANRALKVRLVGSAIEARMQTNLAGRDYLECLAPAHHDGAVRSTQMMASHPCGLWQMTQFHYERGISHLAEMTAFPLGPGDDGVPLILLLSSFHDVAQRPSVPLGKPILADTALTFRFLDIGNGLPEWDA